MIIIVAMMKIMVVMIIMPMWCRECRGAPARAGCAPESFRGDNK